MHGNIKKRHAKIEYIHQAFTTWVIGKISKGLMQVLSVNEEQKPSIDYIYF